MSKIIIHNDSAKNDVDILKIVASVIDAGRISASRYGPQYCYVSIFGDVVVYASRSRISDTFRVADHED